MTQTPTLGRVVLFTVSKEDAEAINKRRQDFVKHRRKYPLQEDTGYVAHFGNLVSEGDSFAATIVKVWSGSVNLQVLLDGTDVYWATSITQGEGPHTWSWPPRV